MRNNNNMHHQNSFRRTVTKALEEAKKLLGTARSPCLPSDVAHTFDDKYLLCEIGTRAAILSIKAAMDQATGGIFSANLETMLQWAREGKTVTMCTDAEEVCAFIQTTTRDVKSNTTSVT